MYERNSPPLSRSRRSLTVSSPAPRTQVRRLFRPKGDGPSEIFLPYAWPFGFLSRIPCMSNPTTAPPQFGYLPAVTAPLFLGDPRPPHPFPASRSPPPALRINGYLVAASQFRSFSIPSSPLLLVCRPCLFIPKSRLRFSCAPAVFFRSFFFIQPD